jgi:hypothetical protein
MDSNQRNQEWASRIADFKSSGQTMSAWCAAHDLSIHQLKYWIKKMNIPGRTNPTAPGANWLPVAVTGAVHESPQAHSLVV